MNPVNWFEIPCNDIERAQRFYETVLDHKLQRNDMGPMKMVWFPMDPEAGGATGTLIEQESYVPSYEGTMVYFSVADVAQTLKRIPDAGGKVLTEKMSIGEYGFVGHFEDCEGNRVGLHSRE